MMKIYIHCIFILLTGIGITAGQQVHFDSIAESVLNNVGDIPGAVSLHNGQWIGTPLMKGGSERPSVILRKELIVTGDVNGDGAMDCLAFLVSSTGGSGSQIHLALFLRSGSRWVNTKNVNLGDRVQIRSASIDSAGVISVSIIRQGNGDAACCPGEHVVRSWRWSNGSLKEHSEQILNRTGIEALSGTNWKLEYWKDGLPVDSAAVVTMRIEQGQISGHAGCNRYFSRIESGAGNSAITIGAGGSTKMMCDTERMVIEDRYLRLLPHVKHFRFVFGKLLFEYQENGTVHPLIFGKYSE